MILASVLFCLLACVVLVWILRSSQVSLGLPIAYLGSLLLIHVPGAVAHILDAHHVLRWPELTKIGIGFTAISSWCFVAGVALVHYGKHRPEPVASNRSLFNHFCLLGGWTTTILPFFFQVPSVSAVVKCAGPIWMLGIMLALRSALRGRDYAMMYRWLAASLVYPVLMLLLGGFMSYGVGSAIIILSALFIPVRSRFRIALVTSVAVVVGISTFIGYFEHRKEIRGAVWGGEDTDARLAASLAAARDISLFDPRNPAHLTALDLRLNQNYFVGLAATRIAAKKVDYLRGRSLWEGVEALVPRALWPDKPVTAGSPEVVAEMTGLTLSKGTSFGVGNVMEFDINFGIPGLIIGFALLGALLGWLDRCAAVADAEGAFDRIFFFFLPAVALIQPNGSLVEMAGGSAAALAAAFAWKWIWLRWTRSSAARVTQAPRHPLAQSF